MFVVRLRGIEKLYRSRAGEVQALRGVDLDVQEGELGALMGPSGSGKSTLLNVLGCLDAPTRGTYALGGRVIGPGAARELAEIRSREIGFVFQSFNLIPVLSARENVALPLTRMREIGAPERTRRADELLEAVGLSACASRRPDELSGGQQQRVSIARALAARPKLLLADEPTASLDSDNARRIMELLSELSLARRVTVLFSTHDATIAAHARRVVTLHDGRIARDVAAPGLRAHERGTLAECG